MNEDYSVKRNVILQHIFTTTECHDSTTKYFSNHTILMTSVAIFKQYIYPHDKTTSVYQKTLRVYEKHHHSLSESIKKNCNTLPHLNASEVQHSAIYTF